MILTKYTPKPGHTNQSKILRWKPATARTTSHLFKGEANHIACLTVYSGKEFLRPRTFQHKAGRRCMDGLTYGVHGRPSVCQSGCWWFRLPETVTAACYGTSGPSSFCLYP